MLILRLDQPPQLTLTLDLELAQSLLWLVRHGPCYNPAAVPEAVSLSGLKAAVLEAFEPYLDADVLYTLSDAVADMADEQRHVEQVAPVRRAGR